MSKSSGRSTSLAARIARTMPPGRFPNGLKEQALEYDLKDTSPTATTIPLVVATPAVVSALQSAHPLTLTTSGTFALTDDIILVDVPFATAVTITSIAANAAGSGVSWIKIFKRTDSSTGTLALVRAGGDTFLENNVMSTSVAFNSGDGVLLVSDGNGTIHVFDFF